MRKKRFETPEIKFRSRNDGQLFDKKSEEEIQKGAGIEAKRQSSAESMKELQNQISKQIEDGANEITFLKDRS